MSDNMNENHNVIDLSDFYFESHSHQRFEPTGRGAIPLQCNVGRAIKIEDNISGDIGCYTMTIYNLDGNHPIWGNNIQVSPKPMMITEQSDSKIVLRGYGYDKNAVMMGVSQQEASFTDYGMDIYHSNGEIIKCVFHRFDRNFTIEYYSGANGLESSTASDMNIDENEKNSIFKTAIGFISALSLGDEQTANNLAWDFYQRIHGKPYLLTTFSPQQYDLISKVSCMLIANPNVNHYEERIIECANYGFYCLYRAIINEDREVFHQLRISLMADTHEWFYQTVADALGISSGSFSICNPIMSMPLIVRTNSDYYNMGYYDFEMSSNKYYDGNMGKFQNLVYNNYNNSIDKGRSNIEKTAKHIENILLKSKQ